jgi:thioredoxin-related protein
MPYSRIAPILAAAWVLLVPAAVGVPLDRFQTDDLAADGRRARDRGVPILLLFSADYCTYCARLMEEFLEPMDRSGEYDDNILIREVKIDSYRNVVDFAGRRVSPEDLAYRYHLSVTPTLLLVDANGRELVQRIVGLGTEDLFGLYLDDAIARALARLKGTTLDSGGATPP